MGNHSNIDISAIVNIVSNNNNNNMVNNRELKDHINWKNINWFENIKYFNPVICLNHDFSLDFFHIDTNIQKSYMLTLDISKWQLNEKLIIRQNIDKWEYMKKRKCVN